MLNRRIKWKRIREQRRISRNPLQIIAVGFSFVIFIGTILLMLPISSRSGEVTNLLTALFTATSSTCVTGLIVVDTYTYWSSFGHWVILAMIQVGGMGFMLIITALSMLIGRKITIKERLLISKSLSIDSMSGIVKLAKRIIFSTLVLEIMGAAILSIRFVRDFGVAEGIKKGIFHSVSAFCNAGFDLMGQVEPYSSLTHYGGDFTVTMTISLLIIVGGLGFYLWNDVLSAKNGRRLYLHTKIVLAATAFLVVFGTVFFLVAEWNNPGTIGGEPLGTKVLQSYFQSVTTRTAGYNAIDQGAMTSASKMFSIMYMFIGGSPGSTAGGVKTVTIAVLILTAIATLKGKHTVSIYGRRIPNRYLVDSITIVMVAIFCVAVGTFAMSMVDGVPFSTALFECVSAFGTVGLTEGITSTLSSFSKLLLIFLMYMGRVGIITLGLAILVRGKTEESKIKYPEGKIIVG